MWRRTIGSSAAARSGNRKSSSTGRFAQAGRKISPGVVETPGHGVSGASQEQIHGFFGFAAGITPLGRTGRDDEIAKAVAFLASEESSFMTGSEMLVDGGIAQV